MNYLLVGLGGFLGSIARYAISRYMIELTNNGGKLPIATLIVNITGSFLIGMLITFFARGTTSNHYYYLLWVVGFCGGFTTFSTFSLEVIYMLKESLFTHAITYIITSVILSCGAAWIGINLIKHKI